MSRAYGRITIDTFSLTRKISLTDHPDYVYRRKFVNKSKLRDSDFKLCVQVQERS
jgi:hypothetical protein